VVRERRGVQVTHDLVQAGDLLLQQVVLLLRVLVPVLRPLQSLQQLAVLLVQVLDQHVRFAVLVQLEKVQRKYTIRARVSPQVVPPREPGGNAVWPSYESQKLKGPKIIPQGFKNNVPITLCFFCLFETTTCPSYSILFANLY